jgi:hypothetical protein
MSDGSIVGTGSNTTGKELLGPYSVNAFCFDTSGHHSWHLREPRRQPRARGAISFTIDLFGETCPRYLVGADGYFA